MWEILVRLLLAELGRLAKMIHPAGTVYCLPQSDFNHGLRIGISLQSSEVARTFYEIEAQLAH
jgi:hypothetical protein